MPRADSSDKLLLFDPGVETFNFQELSPMPGPRLTGGRFAGDKLYVFGGSSLSNQYDDILCYAPEANSWEILGHLPHPVSNYAIAADRQNIYLIGCYQWRGYLGIYDTNTNSYRELTTNLKFADGCALVKDDQLLFFGGVNVSYSRQINNKLYILDLKTIGN